MDIFENVQKRKKFLTFQNYLFYLFSFCYTFLKVYAYIYMDDPNASQRRSTRERKSVKRFRDEPVETQTIPSNKKRTLKKTREYVFDENDEIEDLDTKPSSLEKISSSVNTQSNLVAMPPPPSPIIVAPTSLPSRKSINEPADFNEIREINDGNIRDMVRVYLQHVNKIVFPYAYRILNNWDVSKVTDMSGLFYGQTNFNQSIAGWDVRNVKFFNSMFEGCTSFNNGDGIGRSDPRNRIMWGGRSAKFVGDGIHVNKMFKNAVNLKNKFEIQFNRGSRFNFCAYENISEMFCNARSYEPTFQQISVFMHMSKAYNVFIDDPNNYRMIKYFDIPNIQRITLVNLWDNGDMVNPPTREHIQNLTEAHQILVCLSHFYGIGSPDYTYENMSLINKAILLNLVLARYVPEVILSPEPDLDVVNDPNFTRLHRLLDVSGLREPLASDMLENIYLEDPTIHRRITAVLGEHNRFRIIAPRPVQPAPTNDISRTMANASACAGTNAIREEFGNSSS